MQQNIATAPRARRIDPTRTDIAKARARLERRARREKSARLFLSLAFGA